MNQNIIIKHKYKGKLVRVYKLKGRQFSIGTIKHARIHLLGKQTAGLTCLINKEKTGWKVLDLGSEPDVKIDHKPFTEYEIKNPCTLSVGENILEIVPPVAHRKVFAKNKDFDKGQTYYVARWRGNIVESGYDKNDFELYKGSHIEVEQFTLPRQKVIAKDKPGIPKDMKKPLASTMAAFLVFIALLIGIPQFKTAEPEKPKDNVYTKMIFDSKILKEKKKELQSSGTRLLKGDGGNGQPAVGTKKQPAESKVVASLRQSGLSSTISKIAAQASKSALLVAKLAAMPAADASISAKQLNSFGQVPSTEAQAGKTDRISGNQGFKVAAIGTAGKGGGSGGYKQGSELGNGGVGQGGITLDDTESIVEGGLDREVIAKVIRDHLGQIRYCYDRQLASDSELHGKVKIKFSIDADGQVDSQSVGETTMNNAMVEECILRRIATWKFPKPKGGTKVLVSYPFLFKSVN